MEKFSDNPIPATQKATFIGASTYQKKVGSVYSANHPLAIPRVALTLDLINAYGALTAAEYKLARKAADYELEWFHTPDYISAIKRAEVLGCVKNEVRKRYNLGTLENPYFAGIFSVPATATGGSILAAEEVLQGRIGFNPAGGMHHARAASAQGFSYFNDPVLGIMRLRRAGMRVLYVDIDAHHGDGVELAFVDDPDVLTLSLHMDTSYAYPFSGGTLDDCGTPQNGYTAINVPLPQGVHDTEYRLVFDAVWSAALNKFKPHAVVLQSGTDMLAADPLGKFNISTQCYLEVCATVMQSAPRHPDGTPRLLVTGGGGYHPLLLARAWTGLWALLSGRTLPVEMPAQGARLLREVSWDLDEDEAYFENPLFVSRLDEIQTLSVRPVIERLIEQLQRYPFLQ